MLWFHGLDDPALRPDTVSTLVPPPHTLLLYLVFFLAGALSFDADDRKGTLTRRWPLYLGIATLILFPLGLIGDVPYPADLSRPALGQGPANRGNR